MSIPIPFTRDLPASAIGLPRFQGPQLATVLIVATAHFLLLALLLFSTHTNPTPLPRTSIVVSLLPASTSAPPVTAPPSPRVEPKQPKPPAASPKIPTPSNAPALPAQPNSAPASPANQSGNPTTNSSANTESSAPSAPRFDAAYLNNPAPPYPAMSRRLGEEGRVLLNVLVGADGLAKNLTIAKSSGFTRLDEAALNAVAKWKFVPSKTLGLPVQASVNVPIVFKLD